MSQFSSRPGSTIPPNKRYVLRSQVRLTILCGVFPCILTSCVVSLGHSRPVYAIGGILLNNYETQSLTVAIAPPLGMAGYPMLVAYENLSVGVQYFATFLISTCIFLCGGESMAWLSCNSALDGKRAASFNITLTNICKPRNA